MKKKIDFHLRATCERENRNLLPGIFLFQDTVVLEKTVSGDLSGSMGLRFPSSCEIKLSATADGTTGEAAGSFTLLLVDN